MMVVNIHELYGRQTFRVGSNIQIEYFHFSDTGMQIAECIDINNLTVGL